MEWDDREGRLKQRPPGDRELELRTLSGDERARQRLANEQTEYGIRFKLDPETFQKFKDWDNISESGFSTGPQEAEIDALLEQSRPEVRDQGKDDGGWTTEDGGK